ncbi:hypothetical protein F5Y16DRAFT_361693 [Xylariaceae sp. FL0255]|nr:hypothetical protein F5Y16DRAFT_361693 [Xylariaceae sp. FL0255]
MLFPEEDAPLVKTWIIKRLANNSDADADVLADYVLALLRHDGDDQSIRNLFQEEIRDFLGNDSSQFTDEVLQAVKHRSYIPGAPPALRNHHARTLAASAATAAPFVPSTTPYNPFQPSTLPPPPIPAPFPHGDSRKRAFTERDDVDIDIILDGPAHNGPPPFKQPRRDNGGRRGGRHEDPFGSRSYQGAPQFPMPPGPDQFVPLTPFAPPAINPSAILENIRILQSLLPNPVDLSRPSHSSGRKTSGKRKRRCRDYDTKGFCSRGSNCRFEHGTEPIYIPSLPPVMGDEYDPNNAALPMPPFGTAALPVIPPSEVSNTQGMSRPANNRDSKRKRIKRRPSFTANGLVTDKSKTTIVVSNIPNENFDEVQVRNYFSQFGPITEISMQDRSASALVKFETWDAAHASWSSPKVIFDNRFVKVFWYKEDTNDETTANGKFRDGTTNGHANGTAPSRATASVEPEFDMEEFARKQAEAQKTHEEKVKKRQEIELERVELEARQEDLRMRQEEAKRQLREKLKANGIENDSLSLGHIKSEGDNKKPNSETEALRAQLAALEQEATQLGLDPEDGQHDGASWGYRGRGRGRGYRGRGTFAPRARGSYPYRGGASGVEARHAAYAAYSLDNRPKTISLSGVDFTIPENDEGLRQYLFSIGEFKDIHSTPLLTHVSFKDRKTAEKFEFGISTTNSIPGVKGDVETAWAKTAPESLKATDGDILMTRTQEDDQVKEDGDGVSDYLEEGEVDEIRDHGDMDYEAGEW